MTMDVNSYAEAIVLWGYINKKAHEHLTDLYVPVHYDLGDGDVITEVEFDNMTTYFWIDGEDDPYEWDNFDENVNADIMTQCILMIKEIAKLTNL